MIIDNNVTTYPVQPIISSVEIPSKKITDTAQTALEQQKSATEKNEKSAPILPTTVKVKTSSIKETEALAAHARALECRFEAMTRRINNYPENDKKLKQELESIKKIIRSNSTENRAKEDLLFALSKVTPENVDSIVKVISEGNFDQTDPIFEDVSLLFALQAYRTGKLLTCQFVTFANFMTAKYQQETLSKTPIITVPFFDSNGKWNLKAVEYIKETLQNVAPQSKRR